MNTTLKRSIKLIIGNALRGIANANAALERLEPLNLSDAVNFNLFGNDVWIETTDRSDVEKVLSIAPPGTVWAKSAMGDVLSYSATIDGVIFTLRVSASALPPTCRIVEEEVVVPAAPAVPEHTITRRVLKCDVAPGSRRRPTALRL